MANWLHGRLQSLLCARLDHAGLAATGLDLRVSDDLIQVADIAMYLNAPQGEFPNAPPYVVVEIVSPGDAQEPLLSKLESYQTWSVPNIWVVDAKAKTFSVYRASELAAVAQFELPELKLRITSENVFAAANAR